MSVNTEQTTDEQTSTSVEVTAVRDRLVTACEDVTGVTDASVNLKDDTQLWVDVTETSPRLEEDLVALAALYDATIDLQDTVDPDNHDDEMYLVTVEDVE